MSYQPPYGDQRITISGGTAFKIGFYATFGSFLAALLLYAILGVILLIVSLIFGGIFAGIVSSVPQLFS